MQAMARLEDNWAPSEELKVAQKELGEAQEWVTGLMALQHIRGKAVEGELVPDSLADVVDSPMGALTPREEEAPEAHMPKAQVMTTPEPGPSPCRGWVTIVQKVVPGPKKLFKVVEDDLVEHLLTTSGWEGSGAVCKVGKIRVMVSCEVW